MKNIGFIGRLNLSFISMFLLAAMPIQGADHLLQDEIAAYRDGDLEKVIIISREVIAQEPGNEVAHYYLANAYTRLNQIQAAIQEYSFCLNNARDAEIRSYSEQALRTLQDFVNNKSGNNISGMDKTSSSLNLGQSDMSEAKAAIIQEERELIERHKKEGQERIDQVNADAQVEKRDVPKYVYRYNAVSGDTEQVDNPDYGFLIGKIEGRAQSKINAIDDELSRTQKLVIESYREKLNVVDTINGNH